MIRKILSLCMGLVFTLTLTLKASNPTDEGMWLPLLIKSLNYSEMQKLGCKLSADEIYNINNASIKDAVVQLGGFCTAEVVSSQGLLLTNHHCAYDAIQSQSSTENDYLTDGFWAKTKGDELPIEGLSVKFLVRIEDLTPKVNEKLADASPEDRPTIIQEVIAEAEDVASEDGKYMAVVKDMYGGNDYYLFVYQIYNDIRLVGAPPSSVGKFGGDTDNWMWPRHTGDFAMLRIYADANNDPAEYSEDNVPFKPKHYFPVSNKGIQNGDFAMIMGYPGSTDRYLTSYHIDQIYYDQNPDYIKLMDAKLEIMKKDMDASDEVRIKLASDYASLANFYKYSVGQNRTLRTRGLQEEKQATEEKFMKWVNGDPERKKEYGTVLDDIQQSIKDGKSLKKLGNYLNFAGFGPGIVGYGVTAWRLKRTMESSEDPGSWQPLIESMKAGVDGHFTDYNAPTDEKVLVRSMRFLREDLNSEYQPGIFTSKTWAKKAKAKGGMDPYQAYASYVFSKSILTDASRMQEFLNNPSKKVLDKDPGVEYVASIIDLYREKYMGGAGSLDMMESEAMRLYLKGLREMEPNKAIYPDANSTMRLTYGTVTPYVPRDAVDYNWFTTTDGIAEKENPNDDEFIVPEKLMNLIEKEDFGRYKDKDGTMHVCFLTNNDITGGNSGSPVINGDGELIGIAFDGNWESMASDLVFDDDVVRTISVDIRYVMFIIDKFADARHLVDEMKVVE